MKLYIDIYLLPDPEFTATVLMNSLVSKLHKALCDLDSTSIGVSFPKCKATLGNVLRIHSEKSILNDLQAFDWIGGMSSYCHQSQIKPVPSNVKFRTISRKQPTMSLAKLKRLLKRGSITEMEVKSYRAKMFVKGLDNPYVELVSASNGNKHRRYIEFGPLQDQPVAGQFDSFGLSKIATIPWFD